MTQHMGYPQNRIPNAPMTKFPLSVAPPGFATPFSPNFTNITAHPIFHSPIGPIAFGQPVSVTPLPTNGFRSFGGFQSFQTMISQLLHRSQ